MSSYLTIYGVPKNEGKPIDIVSFSRSHCGEYLTQWVPAEEYHLSWQLEEMAIYPLADFILKDDGAWEDFVDFFTSEKETPYIDCYDIRELFENGDV